MFWEAIGVGALIVVGVAAYRRRGKSVAPHQSVAPVAVVREVRPPWERLYRPPPSGLDIPVNALGDYRPVAFLGEGAMASVYLAQDPSGRKLALKLIRPEMAQDTEFQQRFQREIEIVRRLSHPNVVEVFEAGMHQGQMFMAMEWVEGCTLEQLLIDGPLALDEFHLVARQLAQVFHFAHQRQLLHRDIKPGNLMVTQSGQVKVLDFGLALQQGQSRFTSVGFSMGTPTHMAPEVLTTGEATAGSDQYALGIVFYQMLLGQLPFQARNPIELGMMHVTKEPPPLRKVRSEVSPELESMVLRMLAKEPEKRFSALGEVAVALGR